MTRAIINLRNPALRVPCWSLWFPIALASNIARTVLSGNADRLACASFWRLQVAVFVIGIDGWAK